MLSAGMDWSEQTTPVGVRPFEFGMAADAIAIEEPHRNLVGRDFSPCPIIDTLEPLFYRQPRFGQVVVDSENNCPVPWLISPKYSGHLVPESQEAALGEPKIVHRSCKLE